MSSEQSEGEIQTAPAVAANSQVDITQQATTLTPTTQHVKNPKRVAAGKLVAERTRIAREQQKKDAEAYVIIANNNAKATAAPPEPPPEPEKKNNGLSVNQWIGVGGLAVSLAGIYLKREEIMAALKKNLPEPMPSSVEPEPAREPKQKDLKLMD